MQEQRLKKEASAYREQAIEENLRLWQEIQHGSVEGKKCVVRVKLDPQSNNCTLRDPVMYRVNTENPHLKIGFVCHCFF